MAKEKRKKRTGRVIGDRMEKTVVVAVAWHRRHPLYRKTLLRVTKFYAHDAGSQCRLGDLVRIEETRPISKLKGWRVLEILQRRDVAEVKPFELDGDVVAGPAGDVEGSPSVDGSITDILEDGSSAGDTSEHEESEV
jgi:small subunit ribosomal protein S17